jgi:PKD repeat protein
MTRALLLALLLAGCGGSSGDHDASVPSDFGIGDLGLIGDGPRPLRGTFTVAGCATLDTSTGEPHCSGRAPLTLTFVPIGSSVTMFSWTFMGGAPSTSKAGAPTVTFATAGTYTVTLTAGGSGGTTTTTGTVVVSSATTGSACLADTDCDANAGLFCVCKPGESGCVGALALGFCSRTCAGGVCGPDEVCADLTRGGAYAPAGADGGVETEVWRQRLCVPACPTGTGCRTGLACRDLPALSAGDMAGVVVWKRGCFADVGGDVGDSCLSPAGEPDPSLCLSGRCDRYGARGLCSADCTTSAQCPLSAACASYKAPPSGPARGCVRRCDSADAQQACAADPLLECRTGAGAGALAFTIDPAEADGTTFCVARACAAADACDPAGTCTGLPNGFCLRD